MVLTTSRDEEDVLRTYDLGVNSFITKPVTFAGLVDVMHTWTRYWFEIVELPDDDAPSAAERYRVLLVEDDEDDYLITRDMLDRPAACPVRAGLVLDLQRCARHDPRAASRRLPDRLPPRPAHRTGPGARGLRGGTSTHR